MGRSGSEVCPFWRQVQAADHNGRPPTGGGGKQVFTDSELEDRQRGMHEGLMKKWCACCSRTGWSPPTRLPCILQETVGMSSQMVWSVRMR